MTFGRPTIIQQPGLAGVLSAISQGLSSLEERRAQTEKQNLVQSILNGTYGQTQSGYIHPAETSGMDIQGDVSERGQFTREQIDALALINPQLAAIKESQRKSDAKETAEMKKRNLALFDDTTKQVRSIEEEMDGLNQLSRLSEVIGKKQNQSMIARYFRSYRFDPETGGFTRIGKATADPEEERFIKLIADQTKTIKNDYGARITNLDMEVFLRRFPDLMMTSQGRKEILDTLKDYREAKLVYNKALKQQLKTTKGAVDPYTLDEKVERQIGPQLDKIRQRIENRGLAPQQQQQVSKSIDVVGAQGKPLTREIALKIFAEVGGDVEKAKARALELGYVE